MSIDKYLHKRKLLDLKNSPVDINNNSPADLLLKPIKLDIFNNAADTCNSDNVLSNYRLDINNLCNGVLNNKEIKFICSSDLLKNDITVNLQSTYKNSFVLKTNYRYLYLFTIDNIQIIPIIILTESDLYPPVDINIVKKINATLKLEDSYIVYTIETIHGIDIINNYNWMNIFYCNTAKSAIKILTNLIDTLLIKRYSKPIAVKVYTREDALNVLMQFPIAINDETRYRDFQILLDCFGSISNIVGASIDSLLSTPCSNATAQSLYGLFNNQD